MSRFFNSPSLVFGAAILLRVVLLFYGLYQDSHSPMKYTDIDYYVFTDAAKFVSEGQSPYERATYRYTPLLAWILLPTTWTSFGGQQVWFSFGKALFAVSDIIAGWLILHVLRSHQRMDMQRALKFSSIWLLNPMVATISTRGSSEGFLCVMIMALLWAVLEKRTVLAGVLLGFGVHFKIYPFIYGPSIIWFLEDEKNDRFNVSEGFTLGNLTNYVCRLLTPQRIILGLTSLIVFAGLNTAMYMLYGTPFLQHTYLHHVTRVDHRHNFSPYNMLLYLSSSETSQGIPGNNFESLAFLPQLGLSAILIPLALAKKDLAGTMLSQTFAFVTFNKVCTSQYFLWYLVFLPLYLPYSSLIKQPLFGTTVAALWAGAQGLWLHQGFQLEFLGASTFVLGLYLSSLAFFAINIWILGIIISDISNLPRTGNPDKGKANKPSPAAVKKDI
ncbi:GPI mannosyltransferase 1 [Nannizzia gypsea CBS 118893]|uniref:GPI mannosyltransferase 1 n=1 Tax=Arthroderma gypseum (strain ATCC MYA-4604 / CBS 118893) TaxID=535722 RepID=E4V3E4_ARTGP|nr:GPI mannosyltransferase 1 [Nannizzia gypsea CBS 118893]EFR04518.1 GPI mannosyltransferase 1 [Nannizzia gypsea CBS 118893]